MKIDYTDTYAIAFGDFTESTFEQRAFANDLISAWQSLVESCAKPYANVLDEFLFDVSSTRGSVQMCLDEKSLNEFVEHQTFKAKIDLLDNIFINLTQEHPQWSNFSNLAWWEKRIPKKVTRAFFYGISENHLAEESYLFEIVD